MERKTIPDPIIAVVGDLLGRHYYEHNRLNALFMEHGAPGEPPPGSCVNKCISWLERCNLDDTIDPFAVLGGVLKELMEVEVPEWSSKADQWRSKQERIRRILAKHGLSYHSGGQILGAGTGAPSRSLRTILEARDLAAVEVEFQRALATVEVDPPAGVTAACSLIEALCKVYIKDEGLDLPSKETIKDVWKVVSKHLGLDPGALADQDITRILSGLISVVDGIGALRTHAGSAHGHGRETYHLEPRHARLAIHAAHTLAAFIIETWEVRRNKDTT
jgi:Abortive infection C-terminus